MRDLVVAGVFAILMLMTVRQPVFGAYSWAWVSLMNPHQLCFGFATSVPFAMLTVLVTMAVLPKARPRQALPVNAVTMVWLSMVLWMGVTSLFAIAPSDGVLDRWLFVMKIHFMLLITLLLVVDEKQLYRLVLVVTLSIVFFGVKGGLFTVLTGGGNRVSGPPGGMLGGNNEAAVGFVMMMPYLYWLRFLAKAAWQRTAFSAAMVFTLFAILGTQSRGALLAVLAMASFLGLKSRYPVRFSLGLGVVLALAIAFMPDSWTSRMETIGTYQQDESAQSRLWVWTTLWNTAVDRPFVGAGFNAEVLEVFQRYAPRDEKWGAFASLNQTWVAHSIYFQMLGEHGFVGLGLFLLLWLLVWRQASRVAKAARQVPALAESIPMLMAMTQVGLIGYAAGGAFLSLAYLDLPLYMMAYVVLAERIVARAQAAGSIHVPMAGRSALGAMPS
jgi:putative inorganic carbon (HCO3(-)) transporter